MLNLRQVDENSESSRASGYGTTHMLTIRFNANAIVGNMGESLQFGTQSHDDDSLQDEADEKWNTAAPLSNLSVSSDARSIRYVGTDAVTEVSGRGNVVLRERCVNFTYDVCRRLA